MKNSTNSMSVTASFAVVVCTIGYLAAQPQLIAQETNLPRASAPQALASRIIGTWKLEEASTPGSPSGIGTRLKLFTGTHWCVIQPDPKSGEIVFQHGGRYELD